jgi:hypothetical protein
MTWQQTSHNPEVSASHHAAAVKFWSSTDPVMPQARGHMHASVKRSAARSTELRGLGNHDSAVRGGGIASAGDLRLSQARASTDVPASSGRCHGFSRAKGASRGGGHRIAPAPLSSPETTRLPVGLRNGNVRDAMRDSHVVSLSYRLVSAISRMEGSCASTSSRVGQASFSVRV